MKRMNEFEQNLSETKKRLLQEMMKRNGTVGASDKIVPSKPKSGHPYPLSVAQRQMWYINMMDPNDTTYNLAYLAKVNGILGEHRFRRAFSYLYRKHAIFRTSFNFDGEQPIQRLSEHVDADVQCIHFDTRANAQQDAIENARELVLRPFDLSTPPLCRIVLYKTGTCSWVLLLCMHHLIADAWTMNLLIGDILESYEGTGYEGTGNEVADIRVNYIDYVDWEINRLERKGRYVLDEFWKDYLAEAPPLSTIPPDFPRASNSSGPCEVVNAEIDPGLIEGLKSLCSNSGITSFEALISCFALLLFHLYDIQDMILGGAVSNRPRREFERVAGFFVNTLVFRFAVKDGPCREWISQMAQNIRAAYTHQPLDLHGVIKESERTRSVGVNPLFQIMFNFLNVPTHALRLSDVTFERIPPPVSSSRFDMVINLQTQRQDWHLELLYRKDLYSRKHMKQLTNCYIELLKQICENPCRSTYEVNPAVGLENVSISEGERLPYLFEGGTIPSLVFRVVERMPQAVALDDGSRELTYEKMAGMIETLRSRLRAQNLRRGAVVAVCTRDKILQIPAALAVMAEGAVYLPVDRDLPNVRITRMLDDSSCAGILTDEIREVEGWSSSVWTMAVGPVTASDYETQTFQPLVPGPNDTAYLIFTSGTTGVPKGVPTNHAGFVSMITSLIDICGIDKKDKLLQFFSYSFDGSLVNIFFALFTGATLVLRDRELLLNKKYIQSLIQDNHITAACFTPSYIAEIGFESLTALKCLVTGGEAALAPPTKLLQSSCRYFNLYGPTEASVTTTWHRCTAKDDAHRPVPVGRPIPNVTVAVVHPVTMHCLPLGRCGEILVGGAGLSSGYVGSDELTREKFINKRYANRDRFYRTGDRGYIDVEGVLHYRGRIDTQIKLRGYRIEPGDVESTATQLPEVDRCCAQIDRSTGNERMILYYCASRTLEQHEFRRRLSSLLPSYMLPDRFVYLSDFPLTVGGKIDLQRLPKPSKNRVPEETPPRSRNEKLLARCWERALNVSSVGLEDSFFELGGDSLKIMRVIALLNDSGKDLRPAAFLEAPILEHLAKQLGEYLPKTTPKPRRGAIPMTAVQHWFFQSIHQRPQHYNQAVLLHCPIRLDSSLLDELLQEIIDRHDSLSLCFVKQVDGYSQQYAEEPVSLRTQVFDLRGSAREDEQFTECVTRLHESFHLTQAPLARIGLFRCDSEDRLVVIVHHLVTDFVSINVFVDNLDKGYSALLNGRRPNLGKGTTFGEFCRTYDVFARSKSIMQESAFWDEWTKESDFKLPGEEAFDRRYSNYREIVVPSTKESTALARRLARESGSSLMAVVLARVSRALALWTQEKRVELVVTGHGRESIVEGINCSQTMGWFSALFPLSISLEEADSEVDTASGIEELLRCMPNKGLGYAIHRYIHQDPVLTSRPLPETVCIFAGDIVDVDLYRHFKPQRQTPGLPFSPSHHRNHPLEITAVIIEDVLSYHIFFNCSKFSEADIRGFRESLTI